MSTKKATPESKGWSDAEKAAMKERARELKAEERASKDRAAGESALLTAVADMSEPDRSMATRIHAIVKANAPDLMPKTWYGMPAYANANGKVVCFYQASTKFDTRYATIGFNDTANLDDGNMWATAYALVTLTPAEETVIAALVQRAVS
ncbi:MAG: hypothetical protein V9H69_09650 [Anaerolineae bacterium]